MVEVKEEEIPMDKLETESYLINSHYKTPMSFVTYLDGKDGEKTRILIDKAHMYVFIGDISIEKHSIARWLKVDCNSWSTVDYRIHEEGELIHIHEEFRRSIDHKKPIYETVKRDAWVNKKQLIQLLKDNVTCKYKSQLCNSSCVYRYSDPRGTSTECIYEWSKNFREFAQNILKYTQIDFYCDEGFLNLHLTTKFKVQEYKKRDHWSSGEGDVPVSRVLHYRLLELGYKARYKNWKTIYELGWGYFKGVNITIIIDLDGNGIIDSGYVYEECYRATDSAVCAMYRKGRLMQGGRDLCRIFDRKITFIESPGKKDLPCNSCDKGENEDDDYYDNGF